MVRLESPGWDACRYAVSDRVWALLYILFFWRVQRVFFLYFAWRVELVLFFGAACRLMSFCGKTGEKGQTTQCLHTRAPTHRRSPAWGAAALDVWAVGPVTPPLSGAGCPHMPAHAHARGPTRPNKPPRQPSLSGVPGAHKLPTGNDPPAQSNTATDSGRNMQSPLRSGVARR